MTAPAVGTASVFGHSDFEGTYGTAATVDRFQEFTSETLKLNTKVIQSNGLRGGARNLRRGTRRAIASRAGAGDANFEVPTTGFGRIYKASMGGTPTVTQIGVTTAYTHVYPMGSVLGKSLTFQKQLRDPSGTLIQTLTYPGSKILDAEFSISVDGFLLLKLTIDTRNEVGNIAAAAASYPTTKLFNFSQASLSIAGSPVANVRDATCKITNAEKIDRYFLGGAGLKAEPVDSDFPSVTGQLTAEVLDTGFYDLFSADTAAALSLAFVGDVISGINHESLTISVPEIHLLGKSPEIAGFGVIENAVPWEAAADPGSDPGATITLITTDTAV